MSTMSLCLLVVVGIMIFVSLYSKRGDRTTKMEAEASNHNRERQLQTIEDPYRIAVSESAWGQIAEQFKAQPLPLHFGTFEMSSAEGHKSKKTFSNRVVNTDLFSLFFEMKGGKLVFIAEARSIKRSDGSWDEPKMIRAVFLDASGAELGKACPDELDAVEVAIGTTIEFAPGRPLIRRGTMRFLAWLESEKGHECWAVTLKDDLAYLVA